MLSIFLSVICLIFTTSCTFGSDNSRLLNSREDASKQVNNQVGKSTLKIENLSQNKYFKLPADCRLEEALHKSQQLIVTCNHAIIRMALDGSVLDQFVVTDGRLVRGQIILGKGYFFSVKNEQNNVKYLWLNDTNEIEEISKFADVPTTENTKVVNDRVILNNENKIVIFDVSGIAPKIINEISIPQSFNIAINKNSFAVTTASSTFKEYSFYNLDGNRINLYRLEESRLYDHLFVLDDRRYIINLCSEKTKCQNSQKLMVFDLTGQLLQTIELKYSTFMSFYALTNGIAILNKVDEGTSSIQLFAESGWTKKFLIDDQNHLLGFSIGDSFFHQGTDQSRSANNLKYYRLGQEFPEVIDFKVNRDGFHHKLLSDGSTLVTLNNLKTSQVFRFDKQGNILGTHKFDGIVNADLSFLTSSNDLLIYVDKDRYESQATSLVYLVQSGQTRVFNLGKRGWTRVVESLPGYYLFIIKNGFALYDSQFNLVKYYDLSVADLATWTLKQITKNIFICSDNFWGGGAFAVFDINNNSVFKSLSPVSGDIQVLTENQFIELSEGEINLRNDFGILLKSFRYNPDTYPYGPQGFLGANKKGQFLLVMDEFSGVDRLEGKRYSFYNNEGKQISSFLLKHDLYETWPYSMMLPSGDIFISYSNRTKENTWIRVNSNGESMQRVFNQTLHFSTSLLIEFKNKSLLLTDEKIVPYNEKRKYQFYDEKMIPRKTFSIQNYSSITYFEALDTVVWYEPTADNYEVEIHALNARGDEKIVRSPYSKNVQLVSWGSKIALVSGREIVFYDQNLSEISKATLPEGNFIPFEIDTAYGPSHGYLVQSEKPLNGGATFVTEDLKTELQIQSNSKSNWYQTKRISEYELYNPGCGILDFKNLTVFSDTKLIGTSSPLNVLRMGSKLLLVELIELMNDDRKTYSVFEPLDFIRVNPMATPSCDILKVSKQKN